jgi:hypothetical protein
MPLQKFDEGGWLHASRLPLGGGWRGQCSAPGHEGEDPSALDLTDGCNLGYAVGCSRMPEQRSCDAVRFSVSRDFGSEIALCFVTERSHIPVTHGCLKYEVASATWASVHSDPRIQKMAQCYLESYLSRRPQNGVTSTRAQAND